MSPENPNQLVLATRNRHKAQEIGTMLGRKWEVLTLTDIGFPGEIVENGKTFDENARIKAEAVRNFLARQASETSRRFVLADDSGLEVDALDGAPGVLSARYAGEPSNDQSNNTKLLQALKKVPENRRSAQFRCVLALAVIGENLTEETRTFEGICRGRIGYEPKGTRGFGYDPLFVPDGFSRTFAELGSEEKNRISHRARALAKFKEWVGNIRG